MGKKKDPQERWATQSATYEPLDRSYQLGFDTVATDLGRPAGGRKYVVWYGEPRLALDQRRPVAHLERDLQGGAWLIRSLDGAVLVGLGEGFGTGACLTREDAVTRLGWKIDGRSSSGKHFQTWRELCSIADPPEEDEPDCPERDTLPDPADWQKVVEVEKQGRDAGAPDIAVRIAVGDAAIAAIRNMEARP